MEEILQFLSKYWEILLVILGFFGIAIDCTPWIKINPVKAIFTYLGKAMNKDVIDRIDKLKDRVDDLDKRLDEQERNSKKYRMTSLHDRLFQMHRYFMKQGMISASDLDNFHICVKEYLDNNGNGAIKQKIIPEIDSLPIDYENKIEPFDEHKALGL